MSVRAEVLNILERVFRQHGFASLLLRKANISKEEMGLASEIVYGTIRNKNTIRRTVASIYKAC